MSKNNLILEKYESKGPKKPSCIKNNNFINKSYSKIISEQSSLNITIPQSQSNISIDIASIKRIFSFNQLDYKEYISVCLDKDDININQEEHSLSESLTISLNRKAEKELIEETTDDGEDSTIKEDDNLNEQKNKKDINLPIQKKNDNIFDPNFPLLNNKIVNTFSNIDIDKVPQKYLSLIICGNKAIISLDYLKCIYPTILCCGILNLIYFINILFTINTQFNISFHYFLNIPLALLLIFTGFYGYKKVKKNIYDDEFCIILTNLCTIAPIFIFALSRIYKEDITRGQIIINFLINFFSCFFSFSCIIILKEAERMKKCERDIIIQN